MLRPADRVTEGARAFAARIPAQRLGDAQEEIARHAARPFDHLGRVTRKVTAQELKDASGVLERLVPLFAVDVLAARTHFAGAGLGEDFLVARGRDDVF